MQSIRIEISNRHRELDKFVQLLSMLGRERNMDTPKRTLKGLFFVHAYAIIEHSVYSTVGKTIKIINSKFISLSDIKCVILSLALSSKIASIKDVGRNKLWDKNVELFGEIDSNPMVKIDETLMPTDGRNITTSQLNSIWNVFSIGLPIVPRPELISRINEIAENRRSISHGRNKPEEVGRRYTDEDINKIKNDVNELSSYIVDTFSDYCVRELYKKNT